MRALISHTRFTKSSRFRKSELLKILTINARIYKVSKGALGIYANFAFQNTIHCLKPTTCIVIMTTHGLVVAFYVTFFQFCIR